MQLPAPSAVLGAAAPAEPTVGGRTAVLEVVGRHAPLTAAAAAGMLGVTPAAVRRHLDTLTAAGLADTHEPVHQGLRGRGRPAKAYVLTARGRAELGRAVPGRAGSGGPPAAGGPEDLAADALDFIARTHGSEAVARFAHQRAKAMESRFAEIVAAAGPDPARRSQALAAALDDEGYAATARPIVTGVQLCQGRCPVHRVAAAHPELCEAETAAFGRLLGVPVQRLATLAGGAHVCTTHVASRPPITPGTPIITRRRPVASGRDRP